ncbi:uncharacterized protein BO72DRAFT_10216 [Aspergillus fijiensis CBS 313.89]|uniref:Uncharacterized protein n=1 Tax=Aspergillus fijiensis CBS 313.89 TaxID=1448319 RepID=A0A8G1S0W6_9EURO|nr:uncharacterized protein BO72DRAFT_10216 [Aspergillus fijiensis CBS 313.89]RAK82779.1 hypothetical protein BO72DRAFT_10216 [Aspergillus fijiensis CBS 313.89]
MPFLSLSISLSSEDREDNPNDDPENCITIGTYPSKHQHQHRITKGQVRSEDRHAQLGAKWTPSTPHPQTPPNSQRAKAKAKAKAKATQSNNINTTTTASCSQTKQQPTQTPNPIAISFQTLTPKTQGRMRFIIPLTLLLTSLALAAPTADAEADTADAAAAVVDDAPADEANTQWCRRGYDQCMNNCHRNHGGQRCYHACWVHYCQ